MPKSNPKSESTQTSSTAETGQKGRFAYEGLERVLHEKARLGIMTSLLSHTNGLLFSELKELCDLTDGNLSRHLSALKDEGLVEMWRGEKGNRTVTLCRLSAEGRERFISYVGQLERVIADATRVLGEEKKSTRQKPTDLDGWASGAARA